MLAELPASIAVELAGGERLAVVVDKVLSRPDAASESLVRTAELRETARAIEADGPELTLDKWVVLFVERRQA